MSNQDDGTGTGNDSMQPGGTTNVTDGTQPPGGDTTAGAPNITEGAQSATGNVGELPQFGPEYEPEAQTKTEEEMKKKLSAAAQPAAENAEVLPQYGPDYGIEAQAIAEEEKKKKLALAMQPETENVGVSPQYGPEYGPEAQAKAEEERKKNLAGPLFYGPEYGPEAQAKAEEERLKNIERNKRYLELVREIDTQKMKVEDLRVRIITLCAKPCKTKCELREIRRLRVCMEANDLKLRALWSHAIQLQDAVLPSERMTDIPISIAYEEDPSPYDNVILPPLQISENHKQFDKNSSEDEDEVSSCDDSSSQPSDGNDQELDGAIQIIEKLEKVCAAEDKQALKDIATALSNCTKKLQQPPNSYEKKVPCSKKDSSAVKRYVPLGRKSPRSSTRNQKCTQYSQCPDDAKDSFRKRVSYSEQDPCNIAKKMQAHHKPKSQYSDMSDVPVKVDENLNTMQASIRALKQEIDKFENGRDGTSGKNGKMTMLKSRLGSKAAEPDPCSELSRRDAKSDEMEKTQESYIYIMSPNGKKTCPINPCNKPKNLQKSQLDMSDGCQKVTSGSVERLKQQLCSMQASLKTIKQEFCIRNNNGDGDSDFSVCKHSKRSQPPKKNESTLCFLPKNSKKDGPFKQMNVSSLDNDAKDNKPTDSYLCLLPKECKNAAPVKKLNLVSCRKAGKSHEKPKESYMCILSKSSKKNGQLSALEKRMNRRQTESSDQFEDSSERCTCEAEKRNSYLCMLSKSTKENNPLDKKVQEACGRTGHWGRKKTFREPEGIVDKKKPAKKTDNGADLICWKSRVREMKEEQDEYNLILKEQAEQLKEYRQKYLCAQERIEEQNVAIATLCMNNKSIENQMNVEVKSIREKFKLKLVELAQLPKLLDKEQIKLATVCKEKEQMCKDLQIVCAELQELKAKQCNAKEQDCKPQLLKLQQELKAAKAEIEELQKQRDIFCDQLQASREEVGLLRTESANLIACSKERAQCIKQKMQERLNCLEVELAQCRCTARLSLTDRDAIIREMQGQLSTLSGSFNAAQKQIISLKNHVAYMARENEDLKSKTCDKLKQKTNECSYPLKANA